MESRLGGLIRRRRSRSIQACAQPLEKRQLLAVFPEPELVPGPGSPEITDILRGEGPSPDFFVVNGREIWQHDPFWGTFTKQFDARGQTIRLMGTAPETGVLFSLQSGQDDPIRGPYRLPQQSSWPYEQPLFRDNLYQIQPGDKVHVIQRPGPDQYALFGSPQSWGRRSLMLGAADATTLTSFSDLYNDTPVSNLMIDGSSAYYLNLINPSDAEGSPAYIYRADLTATGTGVRTELVAYTALPTYGDNPAVKYSLRRSLQSMWIFTEVDNRVVSYQVLHDGAREPIWPDTPLLGASLDRDFAISTTSRSVVQRQDDRLFRMTFDRSGFGEWQPVWFNVADLGVRSRHIVQRNDTVELLGANPWVREASHVIRVNLSTGNVTGVPIIALPAGSSSVVPATIPAGAQLMPGRAGTNVIYFTLSDPTSLTPSIGMVDPSNGRLTTFGVSDVWPTNVELLFVGGGAPTNLKLLGNDLFRGREFYTAAADNAGYLAGPVFFDRNLNSTRDPGEENIPGLTVYIDLNRNGVLDSSEPSTISTGQDEGYNFKFLPAGNYFVRVRQQTPWVPSNLVGVRFASVLPGRPVRDFGLSVSLPTSPSVGVSVFFDSNNNGVRDPANQGSFDLPITNQVFLDTNNNAVPDPGEPIGTAGPNVGTWLTVPVVGDSRVRPVLPPGYRMTTPQAVVNVYNVNSSTRFEMGIAPIAPSGSIGGRVVVVPTDILEPRPPYPSLAGATAYLDTNNNAVLDPGERSTTTAADGAYTFGNLWAGNYTVRVVLTGPQQLPFPARTSVTPSLPFTPDAPFAQGNSLTVFVRVPPTTGSFTVRNFNDLNRSGFVDLSETVLTLPFTAYIDANRNGLREASEIARTGSGWLSFDDMPAGTYEVRIENPRGWVQSGPAGNGPRRVTVTPGFSSSDNNLQFASFRNYATISGIAFEDRNFDGVQGTGESLLSGRTIYLDVDNDRVLDIGEPFSVTNSAGAYRFGEVLFDRTHLVRQVVPPGWTDSDSAAGRVYSLFLAPGQVSDRVNFTSYRLATTDSPALYGMVFHDVNRNGFLESNEAGLSGSTNNGVYLDLDNDNVQDATEPTRPLSTGGLYRIFDLPSDGRSATLRLRGAPGWSMTTAAQSIRLTPGLRQNFSPMGAVFTAPVTTGEIAGTVFDDRNRNRVRDTSEPALSGRTVYLDLDRDNVLDVTEPRRVTDSAGAYLFTSIAPGSYLVRQVIPAGWVQTSPASSGANTTTVVAGSRTINVLFGSAVALGSASGILFNDANGNGRRDTGEAALSGWTIFIDADNDRVLDAGERRFTTDAAGNFRFGDLAAGTYNFRVVLQSGWTQTLPASPASLAVTLTAGQVRTGLLLATRRN
jgi:hypothetical protein